MQFTTLLFALHPVDYRNGRLPNLGSPAATADPDYSERLVFFNQPYKDREELERAVHAWSDANCFPFHGHGRLRPGRGGKDRKLEFECEHHGSHQPTGKKITTTKRRGCTAKITFVKTDDGLWHLSRDKTLTAHVQKPDSTGRMLPAHLIESSKSLYSVAQSKRKLSPGEKEYAVETKRKHPGATSRSIASAITEKRGEKGSIGKVDKQTVGAIIRRARTASHAAHKSDMVEALRALREEADKDCFVSELRGDDETFVALVVVSTLMKRRFKAYPDRVQLDSTHCTVREGYYMLNVVAIDGDAAGFLVGTAWLAKESGDVLEKVLKEMGNAHGPLWYELRFVSIDRDWATLSAIIAVWPRAKKIICRYHLRLALFRNSARLRCSPAIRARILSLTFKLVYADTEGEYDAVLDVELPQVLDLVKAPANVDQDAIGFGRWFKTWFIRNWHVVRECWANYVLKNFGLLGVHTTSHVERLHGDVKAELGVRRGVPSSRPPLALAVRKLTPYFTEVKTELLIEAWRNTHSRINIADPVLREHVDTWSGHLNLYAQKSMLRHLTRGRPSDCAVVDVGVNTFSVVDALSGIEHFLDGVEGACSCQFQSSMRLPCRHLLASNLSVSFALEAGFVDPRWSKATYTNNVNDLLQGAEGAIDDAPETQGDLHDKAAKSEAKQRRGEKARYAAGMASARLMIGPILLAKEDVFNDSLAVMDELAKSMYAGASLRDLVIESVAMAAKKPHNSHAVDTSLAKVAEAQQTEHEEAEAAMLSQASIGHTLSRRSSLAARRQGLPKKKPTTTQDEDSSSDNSSLNLPDSSDSNLEAYGIVVQEGYEEKARKRAAELGKSVVTHGDDGHNFNADLQTLEPNRDVAESVVSRVLLLHRERPSFEVVLPEEWRSILLPDSAFCRPSHFRCIVFVGTSHYIAVDVRGRQAVVLDSAYSPLPPSLYKSFASMGIANIKTLPSIQQQGPNCALWALSRSIADDFDSSATQVLDERTARRRVRKAIEVQGAVVFSVGEDQGTRPMRPAQSVTINIEEHSEINMTRGLVDYEEYRGLVEAEWRRRCEADGQSCPIYVAESVRRADRSRVGSSREMEMIGAVGPHEQDNAHYDTALAVFDGGRRFIVTTQQMEKLRRDGAMVSIEVVSALTALINKDSRCAGGIWLPCVQELELMCSDEEQRRPRRMAFIHYSSSELHFVAVFITASHACIHDSYVGLVCTTSPSRAVVCEVLQHRLRQLGVTAVAIEPAQQQAPTSNACAMHSVWHLEQYVGVASSGGYIDEKESRLACARALEEQRAPIFPTISHGQYQGRNIDVKPRSRALLVTDAKPRTFMLDDIEKVKYCTNKLRCICT